MPTRMLRAVVAAALLLSCLSSPLSAQPQDDDAARKERLDFAKGLLDEHQLTMEGQPDEPLPLTKEPVLRYSNPIRNFFSDGMTFLWHDDGRPIAAVSVSIRGNGNVARELTSLSSRPFECRRDGRAVWRPPTGGFVDQTLPNGPSPAGSDTLRLTQMRRIAQQFTAAVRDPDTDQLDELRLLTQPIYRWSSEKAGVVDGTLFAFVLTNDPDVLLAVELVRSASSDEPVWRYSLARMSAPPVLVRLDGEEVWSTEGYWSNRRSIEDPYTEALLGAYPGPAKPPADSADESFYGRPSEER